MKTFVPFIEVNENEGEIWTIWLQVNGNEDELKLLAVEVGKYENPYRLDLDHSLDEKAVDTLTAISFGTNYLQAHQKCIGKLKFSETLREAEEGKDFAREEEYDATIHELFYKGGIKNMFSMND